MRGYCTWPGDPPDFECALEIHETTPPWDRDWEASPCEDCKYWKVEEVEGKNLDFLSI